MRTTPFSPVAGFGPDDLPPEPEHETVPVGADAGADWDFGAGFSADSAPLVLSAPFGRPLALSSSKFDASLTLRLDYANDAAIYRAPLQAVAPDIDDIVMDGRRELEASGPPPEPNRYSPQQGQIGDGVLKKIEARYARMEKENGIAPREPALMPASLRWRLAGVIRASTTLQTLLERAEERGYTVRWGAGAEGMYTTHDPKEIVMDPIMLMRTPERIAITLVHELGHAVRGETPIELPQDQYVAQSLWNEGESERLAMMAADEMGVDYNAERYGDQADRVRAFFAEYRITKDANTFNTRIGEIFGNKKPTGVSETYREYIGRQYREVREARHLPVETPSSPDQTR